MDRTQYQILVRCGRFLRNASNLSLLHFVEAILVKQTYYVVLMTRVKADLNNIQVASDLGSQETFEERVKF